MNCSTISSIGVNRPKYLRKPKSVYSLILIVLLLLISFFTGNARGAQTTLAWDTSSDASVTGYKLYWGTQSQQYELLADVGNFTGETVSNLQSGTTYYFVATAYDAHGNESGYSNEVSYTAPVDCTYSITPASGSFTAAGGMGSANVTTQNGCSWTASSGASWITLTSGSNGTGNGIVYYSVSPNTSGASRTSASTIAGRLFTVNQAGVETYTITASTGTGGTISPSGSTSVDAGGSQTYQITANSGYTISGVTVNGSSVGAVSSYAFNNVTSNQTIVASFKASIYALSTSTSGTGAGTVTANPSGTTFSAGTVVTLTATPNANSTFSGWSGACSGTSATCQVTMNSNLSAAASFAVKTVTYTITASAGTGGTISPSGSTYVNAGGSQTYTATPNSGYRMFYFKVDERYLFTSVASYTFTNLKANRKIAAYFRKK